MTFTPLTVIEELKSSSDFDVCYQRHLSSDDAEWGRHITEVGFPRPLITKLQEKGIYRLFEFQDQALQSIRASKDTVIVAPTANGKTEAFILPIISHLAPGEKKVRALLIYPTKALINDQFQKIRPLVESVELRTACFTGDTSAEDRQKIFQTPPSILLTNIDIIHANLSKSHYKAQFKELLRSVRFVVLDEIHRYVGTFGSHAHMILKRLRRLLETSPVVIGASATVSNAPKFVKDFFGHENIIECKNPRKYSLHFAIVYSKKSFKDAVTCIVNKLNREKIKTLVFTNDHKTSEATIRALQRAGIQAKLHRGGMEPKNRKLIEDEFRCGSLKVLVATPTMELGVDIGSLDAIISPAINFTRTIQRMGRAGREGQESVAIVLLAKSPRNAISEFYHRFPEKYLEDIQSLYFEPRNFLVQKDQLLAAAADEPLSEQEIEDSGYLLEELLREGFLKQDSTSARRFVLTDKGKARLFQYNIRGGSEAAEIRNKETEREIETGRQFPMAIRELHPGAIYSLEGCTYESIRFDMEKKIAWVEPVHTENSTTAHYNVEAHLLKTEETKTMANLALDYGPVSVTETVIGYYVWDSNGKFVEKKQIYPIKYTFETKGLSFRFDLPLPEKREALLHTLAHLAILSGAQITGGELRELGYFFDVTGQLILYESTPGGNGLTKLLLTRLENFLERMMLIPEKCDHKTSDCPCVYLYYCGKRNYELDKKIARNFLEESLRPLVKDINKHEESAFIPSKEETCETKPEDYLNAPLVSGMFIAEDGHRVRSRGELLIDNWLYRHGVLHAYESVIYDSNGEKMRCDFYLPENDIYIEYWGLEDEEYQKRRREKERFYQKLRLRFFAVENEDIYDLDAHLGRMLAQSSQAWSRTEDTSHKTRLKQEKVRQIMSIVEEIVNGTRIGPEWVRKAGDSLLINMKRYAETNDVESMFSYFARLAEGKSGKSVAEWLRSKNLPTVESRYEEVKQVYREHEENKKRI